MLNVSIAWRRHDPLTSSLQTVCWFNQSRLYYEGVSP